MRQFDAVIFDMDGVIFDSERIVMELWISMASEWGIEGIDKIFWECIGQNREATKRTFQKYFGDNYPYEAFREEASRRYHEAYGGGRLPIKRGVQELLAALGRLREQGQIHLALASSTRKIVVEQQLRDAGLLSYFDVVVGGDMVVHSKPDPEIFLKAAEGMGAAPENCYVIEDSFHGIRAAAAAGMHPLMVPDLLQPDEEIKGLAEQVFQDLLEVKEYLL